MCFFLYSVCKLLVSTVHTFGSGEPKHVTCNKVNLRLSDIRNGQSIDLVVLETPRVCSSIMEVA